jgi:integrating conjugative element protein (TIGR03752 family)
MGSTAMTALIGRVPIDGTVNDPYPFKVIVGADNLTANGIDLPEVAGAVVSGTATGDWTLSCVRGQVRSITFVFNDGTVRTLPTPEDAAQAKSGTNQTNGRQLDQIQGGLGWISDPYGIPCIAGERKSNAKQYIGTQSLVTAAGAGVATLLGNQDDSKSGTAVFGSTGSGQFASSTVTGNQAMQQILSSGVSDISDWVNKLYGEAFAAIYVQPNAKVAIHIDQELQIDYEIKGRKVRYAMGATHASTLD